MKLLKTNFAIDLLMTVTILSACGSGENKNTRTESQEGRVFTGEQSFDVSGIKNNNGITLDLSGLADSIPEEVVRKEVYLELSCQVESGTESGREISRLKGGDLADSETSLTFTFNNNIPSQAECTLLVFKGDVENFRPTETLFFGSGTIKADTRLLEIVLTKVSNKNEAISKPDSEGEASKKENEDMTLKTVNVDVTIED